MLGLPSTTEMRVRLPKESFYAQLKLAPAVRESFVRDIEAIWVTNSVKASTCNIADGERVHELLVMRIDLKGVEVPATAVEAVNTANSSKKLFVCAKSDAAGDEGWSACLVVIMGGKPIVGPWQALDSLVLDVRSSSLDSLWDSLASQILYGDTGRKNETIEERFERDKRIAALQEEIDKTHIKRAKEKQFAKKNALFAKEEELKTQLAELEKER